MCFTHYVLNVSHFKNISMYNNNETRFKFLKRKHIFEIKYIVKILKFNVT